MLSPRDQTQRFHYSAKLYSAKSYRELQSRWHRAGVQEPHRPIQVKTNCVHASGFSWFSYSASCVQMYFTTEWYRGCSTRYVIMSGFEEFTIHWDGWFFLPLNVWKRSIYFPVGSNISPSLVFSFLFLNIENFLWILKLPLVSLTGHSLDLFFLLWKQRVIILHNLNCGRNA